MSKAPGSTRRTRLLKLSILGLAIIAVGGWAVSCRVREAKLKTTFSTIQIGDSKENVVQALGEPAEISPCRDSNQTASERCSETYWYKSFLVRWGYAFNGEGKVVDKIYNVSY